MPTADVIRIVELVLALVFAGILFIWIRPGGVRVLTIGIAGVVGGLFAWAAGIYLIRWGVWSYVGELRNPRLGDWYLDLMGVPPKVPVLGFLASLVVCLLTDLPASSAEGGRLQRLSPRTWTAVVVVLVGMLGAMGTTLNAGFAGTIQSHVGSLTFFAALPFWLLQAATACAALWAASGLFGSAQSASED